MAKSIVPTIEEFDEKREEVMKKLDELHSSFKEFTRMVSSNHWRSIGTVYMNLTSIGAVISKFEPLIEKELEVDWVRDEINKP